MSIRRCVLLLVVASATAAGAQTPTGWIIGMKTTIDSGRGNPITVTMRTESVPGMVHSDITMSPPMNPMTANMTMIVKEKDSTMTMVMPGMHMAMIMNPKAMMSGRAGGPPRFSVKGSEVTKSDVADAGPGEQIMGHATHKYHVSFASNDTMAFGTQTCVRGSEATGDMWLAPDLDAQSVIDSVSARLQSAGSAGDGMSSMAAMKAIQKKLPKGTVLRSNLKSTMPGANGPTIVTTTSEVTELSKGPIDPGEFAAPFDYQTMDMRTMMSMAPPGTMDSAMNAGISRMMQTMCAGAKP